MENTQEREVILSYEESQKIKSARPRKTEWSIGESMCWMVWINRNEVSLWLLDQLFVFILEDRSRENICIICKSKLYLLSLSHYHFLFPFISLLLLLFSDLFLFHMWFPSFISPQNCLIWNMITLGLFNFFKSFRDSFGFAFLFLESRECFQILPIVLQNYFFLITFLIKLQS